MFARNANKFSAKIAYLPLDAVGAAKTPLEWVDHHPGSNTYPSLKTDGVTASISTGAGSYGSGRKNIILKINGATDVSATQITRSVWECHGCDILKCIAYFVAFVSAQGCCIVWSRMIVDFVFLFQFIMIWYNIWYSLAFNEIIIWYSVTAIFEIMISLI